jgi:ribosome-binding protein aMBF1 (putative translation factor)
MNDFEYFGKLVEQAREEKGWSQQRLADEVDVDVRTVKKLESGTGNPPMEVVLKYIFLLNISPAMCLIMTLVKLV